jgi:hypothetical protein
VEVDLRALWHASGLFTSFNFTSTWLKRLNLLARIDAHNRRGNRIDTTNLPDIFSAPGTTPVAESPPEPETTDSPLWNSGDTTAKPEEPPLRPALFAVQEEETPPPAG